MPTATPHAGLVAAAPPNIMVIFGGSGDLTRRKLVPALYSLRRDGLLSGQFAVLAIGRKDLGTAGLRAELDEKSRKFLGKDHDAGHWEQILQGIHYLQGDFTDPDLFSRLRNRLEGLVAELGIAANFLFSRATPPQSFAGIATQLGAAGLLQEADGCWRRVVVEKPFGRDLESARDLNRQLHSVLAEHQIYRIDHYLGKETVQNILAYRFANSTVEPIWNHRYIDHVQITVAESIGVEGRANYYETTGALRDMIPNHLLAVLSVVAMEPSNSFEADAVRDEQVKVLRAIQPLSHDDVLTATVRGQYGRGLGPDGEQLPAYRDEPRVGAGSTTETYAAMRLMIDSWRWAGVPFYLRTGKCLPGRYTEVAIQYRHAPSVMFRDSLVKRANVPANTLVLRLQPDEGIGMNFNAKIPGHTPQLRAVEMNFSYDDYFADKQASGYETLIHDCMTGDAMLFKRADNIEAGWALMQPVLDVWSALPPRDFPNYATGSWGPVAADELLARDGRAWRACGSCRKES